MRFTLHYRGQLKANGSPSDKHGLRKVFHSQIAQLWNQPPLLEQRHYLRPSPPTGDYGLERPVGPFVFVPLVTEQMNVVAELDVTLLRPERPGQLITQGGDMDNRLKTLFDALTMARRPEALPPQAVPEAGETPHFFCLLEDDNLITALSVKTRQWLDPRVGKTEVDVQIAVTTRVTRVSLGNQEFA